MTRSATLLALTLFLALALPPAAWANGGTVRVSSQAAGPYSVSVFTDPSPIRTTGVDVSVLVQRADGGVVQDAQVAVWAKPASEPGQGSRYWATRDRATNKLYYAAGFVPSTSGPWAFVVEVSGADGAGQVSFSAGVEEPTLLDNPLVIVLVVAAPIVVLTIWYMVRPKRTRRRE